ncbi:MAG: hypothetical protein IJW08_08570 [Lentisphaeria bacterium]|nr:hypothetical protein [Lentisphaeria bacterium]MBR7119034.1 hypothetical protein [Lentisphaeria bacterium]
MRNSDKESGSALVAVLCLIFTAGILTTATLSISKSGSFDVSSHLDMQRSVYIAEGAANRVQWLIAADRYSYPGEVLGYTDYSEYDFDRYIADGVVHKMDYYGTLLQFTINDALGGIDFSGTNYRNALTMLTNGFITDTDWAEKLEKLRAKLDDYTDSDDNLSEEGMESGEYEEIYASPLPRNDGFQFREELLYIDGFREIIPLDKYGRLSRVRLIPPENTINERRATRPSLFTADLMTLRTYGNLTDEEAQEVLEALREWKENRVLLTDSLDPLLLESLSNFSGQESGYYTIMIEPDSTAPRPFRRLVQSFEGYSITGPTNQKLRYLEWMLF